MVGPSKILTVSYGTFSCTLEGFDDPFSTMRGIAEYFRDLAADDRYFGAEPPTPDAEMLHKIAEREVNRRVESQLKDDGIVLRQVEDHSQAPAPEAPAPKAEPVATEEPETDPSEGNMFADIAAPSSDPTSLTAKLSRIRAVVGAGAAGETATAAFTGSIDAAFADVEPGDEAGALSGIDLELGGSDAEDGPADHEDEAAEAVTGEAAPEDEMELAEEAEAAPAPAPEWDVSEPAPAQDPEFIAEEPATVVTDYPASMQTAESAPEAQADPDADAYSYSPEAEMEAATEAEALEDLAALDGAQEQEVVLSDEDMPQADGAGTEEAPLADTAEDAPVEPAWDDLEDAAEETRGAPDVEAERQSDQVMETISAAIADASQAEEPEPSENLAPEAPAETAAEDQPPEDSEDEGRQGLAARIVKLKRAAMEMSAKPQVEETPIPAVDMVADEPAHPAEAADEPEDDDALFAETDAASDEDDDALFGEADTFDLDTAPAAEGEDSEAVASETEETEAGEADAAEQNMLAAIAAATHSDAFSDDDDDADEDEDDTGPARPKSVAFTPEGTGEDSEDSFDRILEQTNSRMDESEGNRRRTAIAHLKAAVAATKADRLLKRRGDSAGDAEEQSQYRDDLAHVVRPQRPTTETRTPTERPAAVEDSSPLMLVSELRVDEAAGDGRAPGILPRRIAREEAELAGSEDDEQSFAEFAESMGATELPDLLEAAAAYSAFVEGRREFSRPQLMRRVANYEQDRFTREAGLRSFGQLLRQGKLQKLKRGQFTVTENCRFNPEARIAGE